MEIEQIPGPELDVKLAIMLGVNVHIATGEKLSSSWNGMRLVVEEMQRRGFRVRMADQITLWKARFFDMSTDLPTSWVNAETAPHAVALAAVKALGGEQDGQG